MARIMPAHPRAGAEFGETETALKALIFLRDEAVVEIDVMGDEDAVAHELQEAFCDLGEGRRTAYHGIRNARQPHDLCGNGTHGIYKGVPFADDFMATHFDRADFGDAIGGGPAARCFNVDD